MDISSGRALFISIVTGGPPLAVATFNNDFIPIATGIAVGTVMFWWSIRNTTNDQYIKNLHSRIQESQDEIKKIQDDHYKEIADIRETLSAVQVDLRRVNTIQDKIQKQLAVHSCPAPSDPNAKCRLPEIISTTLSL